MKTHFSLCVFEAYDKFLKEGFQRRIKIEMLECQRFSSSFESSLQQLNPVQRQAVETTEGALLVLAGAGTGKTRVLTTRLAYLCMTRRCYPSQMLSVTFTNKAAQEMKGRVLQLLPEEYQRDSLWLGTFHHIGLRILRRHGEHIGLSSQFTILDTDDQLRLLKQVLKMMGLDDKQYPPKLVLWVIGRLKDRGLMPHQTSRAELERLKLSQDTLPHYQSIYVEYQAALRNMHAVDFGDLILLNIQLFQNHPDVLKYYHQQFRYLSVDEYQDINVSQYLWLRLLAAGSHNVCCVGDDDQSIYGWRGAEIDHILCFERDFSDATLIRLEDNYRSTPAILGTASHLISHNKKRLGKTLRTSDPSDSGEKIFVRGLWDDKEEARFVGHTIEDFLRQNAHATDMAVLVRAGFQTREFEERFILLGIPYRIIGSVRFYERLEIKDALAYLKVVVNPNESLAFERILNTPKRGLGSSTVQKLHQISREQEISLFQSAVLLSQTDTLRGSARHALYTLTRDILHWKKSLHANPLTLTVQMILDESGYMDFWKKEGSIEAAGRLENLKELVRVVQEFEHLEGFLEHVSLVTEKAQSTQEPAVSIMTLHMAKGLEFETVFLTGWEEGLFPSPKTLEEHGTRGLEEERRLAYVGITRAKKRVVISFAWNRRFYQGWQKCLPSRFIDQLPEEFITVELGGAHSFEDARFLDPFPVDTMTDASVEEGHFRKGEKVFHGQFGHGTVRAFYGSHLEIAFQDTGIKKVISRFVQRRPDSEREKN